MWDVRACRGCLATGCKLEKIGDASRRIYSAITGVEIRDGDGYPTYICLECKIQIKRALGFRRKARRAYFVMKEIMAVRKQVTYADITSVNRTRTNLKSSMGYCLPSKMSCYTVERPDFDLDLEPEMNSYTPILDNIVFHTVHLGAVEEEPTLEIDLIPEPEVVPEPEEPEYDMTDIFKDLPEENFMSDDDAEEKVKKKTDKKKKRPSKKDVNVVSVKVPLVKKLIIATALSTFDIRVLSLEERTELFDERLKEKSFKLAMFKCGMCVEVFKDMTELMDHVDFHNQAPGRFICSICKTKVMTQADLDIHMSEHHFYEYKCTTCWHIVYTQEAVVNHYKKHQSIAPQASLSMQLFEKVYYTVLLKPDQYIESLAHFSGHEGEFVCVKCNIGLKNQSAYDYHMAKHNPPTEPSDRLQCDVCGIWSPTKISLARHLTLRHKYRYDCRYCDAVIYDKSQAQAHKNKHRVLVNTNRTCNICFKQFKSDIGLVLHVHAVHYAEKFIHYCNVCGLSFSNTRKLYQHQLKMHQKISLNHPLICDSEYECKHCDFKFMTQKALNLHYVRQGHEEAKLLEYTCLPCRKIFETNEECKNHIDRCYLAVRLPKKCSYCDVIIHTSTEYTKHYAVEHPDLQYVPTGTISLCELCGKSCPLRSMAHHMKVHHSGVYMSCQFCEASELSVKQYICHVLLRHTYRPYHCAICNSNYKFRSDCRDHILKTHAPVRPYKCTYCDREFSHIDFLNAHSKKIHNYDVKKNAKKKWPLKGRLYVYPHLKINVSLISKEVMDKAEIEICDYLDKNLRLLDDISEHVIFDDPRMIEDNNTDRKRKKKTPGRRPRKRVKNDDVMEVAREATQTDDAIDFDNVDTQKLEVIDQNGEQYVMIKNVLYKIEEEN